MRGSLKWQATEVAELLETSVASVNSALQRARATLARAEIPAIDSGEVDRELLERYVAAFEAYDFDALTSLIREDAIQSMPPFDMWLAGRDDIFAWWVGPGNGCRGSRVLPVRNANGSPAFGQYKPDPDGDGYIPQGLQVIELKAAGSASSRSSSTGSGSSRSSGYRPGSIPSTSARPMNATSSSRSGEAFRR